MTYRVPDSYFEELTRQIDSPQGPDSGYYDNLFVDTLEPESLQPEGGNVLFDFVGSSLWGAASGLSWGITEWGADRLGIGPDEEWGEMSAASKAGWILGEGAALLAPWGPFGLMAKGSKGIVKLSGANKFIKEASENTLKGLNNLSSTQAKGIIAEAKILAKKQGISPEEVLQTQFGDEVSTLLTKAGNSKEGVGWLANIAHKTDQAENSSIMLLNSGAFAIKQGFKNVGKEITDGDAMTLAAKWVHDLKGGKAYVNDVAEWTERSLRGSGLPFASRKMVSSYLGMSTQDLGMMATHGLITSKFKSMAHGEEWDPAGTVWHSGIMALLFPGVRMIGRGGNDSIMSGIKAYWKRYSTANYSKILDDHGGSVLRKLGTIMTRGSKKDLYNGSRFTNTNWTLKSGKKLNGKKDMEDFWNNKKSDKYATDNEMLDLFGQMKGISRNEFLTKWKSTYFDDFIASIPRMAAGVAVMNKDWLLNPEAFGQMDGSEIASHIFMAMIMTKGKGAWGRHEKAQYFADFAPEKDLMRKLNINTETVKEFVQFHDQTHFFAGAGSAFHTTELGQEIIKTIDTALSSASVTFSANNRKSKVDVSKLTTISNIYDIIKTYTEGSRQSLTIDKLLNMDAQNFNKLVEKLNQIVIRKQGSDITRLENIDGEGIMTELTRLTSKNTVEAYKEMFKSLGELGFGLGVNSKGEITGSIIDVTKSGDDLGNIAKVNEVLLRLNELGGMVSLRDFSGTEANLTYDQILKNTGLSKDQLDQAVSDIIGRTMDKISADYNVKTAFDVADNPVLRMVENAKGIEAADKIWNIISPSEKVLTNPQYRSIVNIHKQMNNIFGTGDVRGGKPKFGGNIFDYAKLIEGYTDPDRVKIKPNSKEEQANTDIIEMLTVLQPLFNVQRVANGGMSSKKRTREIKFSDLKEAYEGFKAEFNKLPKNWRSTDMQTTFEHLFIDRLFKSKGMNPQAIPLARYIMDNNLGYQEDGVLYIPKKDRLEAFLKGKSRNPEEIKEILKAYDIIESVLGKDVVKRANFAIFETMDTATDMGKYVEAARKLGNERISDFLDKTSETLSKITIFPEGFRVDIETLQLKIAKLIQKVDPKTLAGNSADVVNEMTNIIKELQVVESRLAEKSKLSYEVKGEHKGPLSDAIAGGTKLIESLQEFGALPIDTIVKAAAGKDGFEGLPAYKKLISMESSLQENLTNIILSENSAIEALNSAVTRLQNFILNGRRGNGLSAGDAQRSIEYLVNEWTQAYKGVLTKGVTTVSELFEKISEGGMAFSDGIEVIKSLELYVAKQVLLNNKNHPDHQLGLDAAQALEKGSKVHDKQRDILSILKDYKLTTRTGEVDPGFLSALNQDNITGTGIGKVLKEYVKKHIYAGPETTAEKRALYRAFIDKSPIILLQLRNQRAVTKLKIVASGLKGEAAGVAVMSPDVLVTSHPNTEYFRQRGFKVQYLDDSFNVDTGGKLRSTSIDLIHGSPEQVQRLISEAIVNSATKDELLRTLAESGEITQEAASKLINEINVRNNEHRLIYARLSPSNKILFQATKKNLDALNKDFADWYDAMHSSYVGQSKQKTFEAMFKDLRENNSTSRHIIELKLLAPYLSRNGTGGMFDKLIEAYHGGVEADYVKIQADLFKRGYLIDGGTTQRLDIPTLKFLSSAGGHSDPLMRAEYRRIWKDQKGRLLTQVLDETMIKGDKDHPLNIRTIVRDNLTPHANNKTIMGRIVQQQLADINSPEYQGSLNNSLLDGAKFASEGFMKVLMSMKGMWNTSFRDGPNGAKTIIFATGDNQMAGKGFIIYHPEIARQMPDGVDIMLGTESAKDFKGLSIKNDLPIKPYKINRQNRAGSDWAKDLKGSDRQSRMYINVEDVGISFTSKNTKGVTISPSTFDFLGRDLITKATDWMGIDSKLDKFSLEWNFLHNDGGQLAHYLNDINEVSGISMERGDAGVLKKLLVWGAQPGNFLVASPLRRILRNKNYEQLRTVPNMRGGEDNFIIPNVSKDLSVPVHTEFSYLDINGNRVVINKAKATIGGIAIPWNTAKLRKAKSNIEQDVFIFRDKQGIDYSISLYNGKFRITSTFYDSLDKLSADKKYGADVQLKTSRGYESWKHKFSKSTGKEVEQVLTELNKLADQHGLDFKNVFDLLKGNRIRKGTGTIELSKVNKKRAKLFNIAQAAMSNAIPVVGHDKVAFRVEKILENLDGLTEVNVDDLRRIMQRDNDGDHLYTHTSGMPWEIWKAFSQQGGMKTDFNMLNNEHILKHKYVNIFGIKDPNDSFKVGEEITNTGFHNYANRLATAKMNMGVLIGMRSSLSWLSRTGFTYEVNEGTPGNPKMVKKKLLKDLIDVDKIDSKGWKVLDTFYDLIQNTVDIHGGIHELVGSRAALENFLYYGELPPELSARMKRMGPNELQQTDPTLHKFITDHQANGGIFQISEFSNTQLNRHMFIEIIQTLKKANMIQNDTWDEAGSRNPEPFELKTAYYNIKSFFDSPSRYLARRMITRIRKVNYYNKDVADELLTQYIKTFYGEKFVEFSNADRRKELYQQMLKGYAGQLTKTPFDFDSAVLPVDRYTNSRKAAFEYSISGKILQGLVGRNIFWEPSYEGVNKDNRWKKDEIGNILSDAGVFVRDLESVVEMSRLIGEENLQQQLGDEIINIQSFGIKSGNKKTVRNRINNGVLKELIQREFENLTNSLEYFRGEHFTNPNKIEKIQGRLANLATAKEIMNRHMLKDMVVDRNVDIHDGSRISTDGKTYSFKQLKTGQTVAIYEVRGDIKLKDKATEKRLFDYENADGYDLDYGQLKFKGYFTNKSRPLKMFKGTTYIVDKKPTQRELVGHVDNIYNNSLRDVTYGGRYLPEAFMESDFAATAFREAVATMRLKFSLDHSANLKKALSHQVLRNPLFAMEFWKDTSLLREFWETWSPQVGDGQDPSIILRYLVQPQPSATYHTIDHNNNYVPSFKTNRFLLRTVLNFADEFSGRHFGFDGLEGFSRDLVGKWEERVRRPGIDANINVEAYERAVFENYDWTKMGPVEGPLRSLLRYQGLFIETPYFDLLIGDAATGAHKISSHKILKAQNPSTGESYNIIQTGKPDIFDNVKNSNSGNSPGC